MQTNPQHEQLLRAESIPNDRLFIGSDYITLSITEQEYDSKPYKYFTPMYKHKNTYYLQYPLKGFSKYKAKNMANFYNYFVGGNNAN